MVGCIDKAFCQQSMVFLSTAILPTGAVSKAESKTRLLNIVMQLRKCCNHPYLFDGAVSGLHRRVSLFL